MFLSNMYSSFNDRFFLFLNFLLKVNSLNIIQIITINSLLIYKQNLFFNIFKFMTSILIFCNKFKKIFAISDKCFKFENIKSMHVDIISNQKFIIGINKKLKNKTTLTSIHLIFYKSSLNTLEDYFLF